MHLLRTNLVLRVLASLVLVAVLVAVVVITGLPVLTIISLVRDGSSPWLLAVAALALSFSIYVIRIPLWALRYLWTANEFTNPPPSHPNS